MWFHCSEVISFHRNTFHVTPHVHMYFRVQRAPQHVFHMWNVDLFLIRAAAERCHGNGFRDDLTPDIVCLCHLQNMNSFTKHVALKLTCLRLKVALHSFEAVTSKCWSGTWALCFPGSACVHGGSVCSQMGVHQPGCDERLKKKQHQATGVCVLPGWNVLLDHTYSM